MADTPRLILGISAYYHDSAAALIRDGAIVAAAQEERFSRRKHDPSFPTQAIQYVLREAQCTLGEVDAVVFYDKPYIKFERLLETYHAYAPRGLVSFLSAIPVWLHEKLFIRRELTRGLRACGFSRSLPQLYFSEHHLSHAASAFYPSPFARAAILTVDGVGEWTTASIARGEGADITVLRELHFPHSLGLLYSAFTYYCGFKVNSGEYKLMGLAPYGTPGPRVEEYKRKILETLIDLKADGSVVLNMRYFSFAIGLRMSNDRLWGELFGLPPRSPESELTEPYMDLALAIQHITEEVLLRLARTARELTGLDDVVMAGGVALNCVANSALRNAEIFKRIWIQPAAGDAGGALGAALAFHHISSGTRPVPSVDAMQGAYLGPAFSNNEILQFCATRAIPHHSIPEESVLCARTAELLSQGAIVGWFQGRMEWGPRALGNRSILADPRDPLMQKRLNLKIKFREGFRPFAPIVPEEKTTEYFEYSGTSPYMLFVAPVQSRCRQPARAAGTLWERLYTPRSDIPAVTHLDYSARLQTVARDTNPRLWQLLSSFEQLTGCAVLVNTSFNVRGEPIVCTPEEAYRCFMSTDMDALVLGNVLLLKSEQPSSIHIAPIHALD